MAIDPHDYMRLRGESELQGVGQFETVLQGRGFTAW
jgi:hypothetical protein